MVYKILVVDDEPLLQRILADEFEDAGYDVCTASSGDEAFQILATSSIQLMVSDVKMPRMSGIQLLQKAHAMLPSPPPTILVSAFSEITNQEAYDQGAQGVFSKPIDFEALSMTVRKRLLPIREQYCAAVQEGPSHPYWQRSFPALNAQLRTEGLSIGRGGFYLHMTENFPRTDDLVHFAFICGEKNCTLEGSGVVRWIRSPASDHGRPGLGVEFIYLNEASLDVFAPTLEKLHKPFIPFD